MGDLVETSVHLKKGFCSITFVLGAHKDTELLEKGRAGRSQLCTSKADLCQTMPDRQSYDKSESFEVSDPPVRMAASRSRDSTSV
jgi:hypothetical protein